MRAKCAEDEEQYSYRAYVAETLRLQGEGKHPSRRWIDIIDPPPEDERSGDEIAISVLQGLQGGE